MYVALSLTPSFSAKSGISPAPSAESFRTVSFAEGQRLGGCCPTIRYCGKAPPFHRGTVGVGAFRAQPRPDRLTLMSARQRRGQSPGRVPSRLTPDRFPGGRRPVSRQASSLLLRGLLP